MHTRYPAEGVDAEGDHQWNCHVASDFAEAVPSGESSPEPAAPDGQTNRREGCPYENRDPAMGAERAVGDYGAVYEKDEREADHQQRA